MKKLVLVLSLCAMSAFAQTVTSTSSQEVFGGVGAAVVSGPATKVQVSGGYVYNFNSTEAVALSYDFTPFGTTNANTFLGTYKRSFGVKPLGSLKATPFLSVGAGGTDFSGGNLKFSTRFGAGFSVPVFASSVKGVKLTLGVYGNKIDTVPVFFSTAVTLSKTF